MTGRFGAAAGHVTLTPEDAEAIHELANIDSALAERNARLRVRYGNIDYATSVQGIGLSMPQERDWPVAEGDFFNERDIRRFAPVVVLGQTVAKILFPPEGVDAVGKYILIGNIPFEVIGVMTRKAHPLLAVIRTTRSSYRSAPV